MNAKNSMFFICVETVIYLLLYSFIDCTLNVYKAVLTFRRNKSESNFKIGNNLKIIKPQWYSWAQYKHDRFNPLSSNQVIKS